jgi:hypothetical protein
MASAAAMASGLRSGVGLRRFRLLPEEVGVAARAATGVKGNPATKDAANAAAEGAPGPAPKPGAAPAAAPAAFWRCSSSFSTKGDLKHEFWCFLMRLMLFFCEQQHSANKHLKSRVKNDKATHRVPLSAAKIARPPKQTHRQSRES